MTKLITLALLIPLLSPGLQQVDPGLKAAVQRHLKSRGDHDLPRFKHALIDLNGDGRKDAIVLLQDQGWCGSGGCNMLVFRGTKAGFTFVSESTITSEPIRVSRESVRGWKTLIVYSKGTGDVVLRFDGTGYQVNPSMQNSATPAQLRAARVVMK